jgi:hypothetical protein
MSNSTTPDPLQQLQFDASAIIIEIERLTGLRSRWSGNIVVGTQLNAAGRAAYFGAKSWNCDIIIHQDRLAHPGKYSTLVHEAFHSVSVGLNQSDFDILTGYEEGVVEACTRLFRNPILTVAGLPPAMDVRTSYNRYLIVLEDLRTRTNKLESAFYLTLITVALVDRESTVLQWIQDAEPTKSPAQIMQETSLQQEELQR